MEATEMTLADIALRFCEECLGWDKAEAGARKILEDHQQFETSGLDFTDLGQIESVVADFLETRYWMQINRDLTSEFKWLVTVGHQNLSVKGSIFAHATARNDDLGHAMLEACGRANELSNQKSSTSAKEESSNA